MTEQKTSRKNSEHSPSDCPDTEGRSSLLNEEVAGALNGWKKQGSYDNPRLSEIVRMYEEIGFEVRLEPFDPSDDDKSCSECMKADRDRYKTVYTRKKEVF